LSAVALATDVEAGLRTRLGIPGDARQVLVFAETSHWDPNWLRTSEEYFEGRVAHVLDAALDELTREEQRVFSIESLFFVRLYWERRPTRRAELRRLVNDGRLRLTGTGLTSPDTLLPSAEAILRDFLLGQEWLRERGMTAEPRLAYFADDFGHSPALPSLLRAMGYDQAAVTRIDGAYFVACDYRREREFPLLGSSAHLLTHELRTADFLWRGPDGAEVLCHWNPFTYFQGDMLAYVGVIRWMGRLFGAPWRTSGHVARRVAAYAHQLSPLARTPYLFCPIGCDFNDPIPGLHGLLSRHNREHYERTGVWVVLAGLDDYLDLVGCHRARLPVLELDPNPTWMGFYASRPEAKQRCNRIGRKLDVADRLTVTAPPATSIAAGPGLAEAWDLLAIANHHDFITGTSPDRVWLAEQLPWLERAERLADQALVCLVPAVLPAPAPAGRPPRWSRRNGRIHVETDTCELVVDERVGGCLTSLATSRGELLAGPANDLVAYHDTGGLWRHGHEYRGGAFVEVEAASRGPAQVDVHEEGGALVLTVRSVLDGRPVIRRLFVAADGAIVRCAAVGSARRRRTITCRFPTTIAASALEMDVPGGVVTRPREKLHSPTFWPARTTALARDGDRGLALFLGGPASVALGPRGELECVALRNACREIAFGVLPVLAHPAAGDDGGEHTFDYALAPTGGGDLWAEGLLTRARAALDEAWLASLPAGLAAHAEAVVSSDRPDVLVTAVKAAHRGHGLVVRLQAARPARVRLRLATGPLAGATLCDARERDLGALEIDGDTAVATVTGAVTSVRLVPAAKTPYPYDPCTESSPSRRS
jgi:hypothetical protein